jgi:hypothetical protein
MFLDGNAKVGEAKVYATRKEMSQDLEIKELRAGFVEAINRLDFARSVIVKKSSKDCAEAGFKASKKELRDIIKKYK